MLKKKRQEKKGSDIDPKILGTGQARKAGEKLKGRKAQIDDILGAATGGKPRKGSKEQKDRR